MIWVSLIRGINVGGNRKIAMERLRAVHVAAGLKEPRTLLQSGNVVFAAGKEKRDALDVVSKKVIQPDPWGLVGDG